MPKIAIFSDPHIGARNDNESIARIQDLFYRDFMVPFLVENGIHVVFCGGDFFDKRTHVSLKSMERARGIERLFADHNLEFHCLVGNHDTLYRDTNDVNSLVSFFRNSPGVRIYSEPVELPEYNILLSPWINSQNFERSLDLISSSKMRFCLGHFGIQGFEFHKGAVCEHGLDQSIFNHFELVISGHFHTRSKVGNIVYVGSPYEMCWSDYNDPRGFHVFDTDTGELEFIKFDESLFFTVSYSGGKSFVSPYSPTSFEDKHVKLLVKDKGNAFDYDTFVKSIQLQNPADFAIIETKYDISSKIEEDEEEVKKHIKGNLEVIQSYIDAMTDVPEKLKSKVKDEMIQLYNEALG